MTSAFESWRDTTIITCNDVYCDSVLLCDFELVFEK
jgi:hypothetical protein